jgi:hypothetical protein
MFEFVTPHTGALQPIGQRKNLQIESSVLRAHALHIQRNLKIGCRVAKTQKCYSVGIEAQSTNNNLAQHAEGSTSNVSTFQLVILSIVGRGIGTHPTGKHHSKQQFGFSHSSHVLYHFGD